VIRRTGVIFGKQNDRNAVASVSLCPSACPPERSEGGATLVPPETSVSCNFSSPSQKRHREQEDNEFTYHKYLINNLP
jgi:hypothetical protein